MLHERMWHSVTERLNVSRGKLVAAVADAFDLLSAVKHVHSRFNNCQTTIWDRQICVTEHGRVSDDDFDLFLWIFSVQLHVHFSNWTLKFKLLYLLHHIRCVKWNLQDMLCKHSHIKCETWAQIHSTTAEIHNFFQGVVFYWHTLWVNSPPGDLRVIQLTKFNLEDDH